MDIFNYLSSNAFRSLLKNMVHWEEDRFQLYAVITASTGEDTYTTLFTFDIHVQKGTEPFLSISYKNLLVEENIDQYATTMADFINIVINTRVKNKFSVPFEYTSRHFFLDTKFTDIGMDIEEVDKVYYHYFDTQQHYCGTSLSEAELHDVKYPMSSLVDMIDILSHLLKSCCVEELDTLETVFKQINAYGKYLSWYDHVEKYQNIIRFLRLFSNNQ
jgi:hypothetical protein